MLFRQKKKEKKTLPCILFIGREEKGKERKTKELMFFLAKTKRTHVRERRFLSVTITK